MVSFITSNLQYRVNEWRTSCGHKMDSIFWSIRVRKERKPSKVIQKISFCLGSFEIFALLLCSMVLNAFYKFQGRYWYWKNKEVVKVSKFVSVCVCVCVCVCVYIVYERMWNCQNIWWQYVKNFAKTVCKVRES